MCRWSLLVGMIVILSAVAPGCSFDSISVESDDERADTQRAASLPFWTTPDGNRIPYELGGNPDSAITIVLIHCWMCDHTFWDAQLPALAESYRTLRFDLPGHGGATDDRDPWTVAAYGDDVAGLIGYLGLGDVVLVGHSMGGPVSLRVAASLPGQVRGIVAVDTLHDAEFSFEGDEVQAMIQAFEDRFVGTCRQFVEQMFVEEGADEIVAMVRERSCDARRATAGTSLMRNYSTIDIGAWMKEAGVPIRAINAAVPHETKVEVNRRYADFDVQLMEGVGHYPHMTRPEEFNERMLGAISSMIGAGEGS